jgi:hypothetical protein
MSFVLSAAILAAVAILVSLIRLLRAMSDAGRNLPVTADWIDDLSIERYRPMMRLLDSAELESLRSQPGFTSQAAAKLRAQRCRMFRGYLKSLTTDFGRVCGAIKILMVQSRHDRSELALALVRQQFLFAAGVIAAQFRLVLYRFGLCGVDVTALVRNFDSMRIELRTLVPSALPTRA